MNEEISLFSLVAFVLVGITGASWRLYVTITNGIDEIRKEAAASNIQMRNEFSHQVEAAVAARRTEIETLRQAIRDEDSKFELFRREISAAIALLAQKEDIRRIDTKVDNINTATGTIAAEVSVLREMRRGE